MDKKICPLLSIGRKQELCLGEDCRWDNGLCGIEKPVKNEALTLIEILGKEGVIVAIGYNEAADLWHCGIENEATSINKVADTVEMALAKAYNEYKGLNKVLRDGARR